MIRTPKTELDSRARRLQERMALAGMDAVVVLQTADMFYFTGTVQQGVYYLPVRGEPVHLVRRDLGRALMESGLTHILPLKGPKDIPGRLAEVGLAMPERPGYELDCLPVNLFQRFDAVLGGEVADASPLIRAVRSVKSAWEVERIRAAARVSDRVFARAREVIEPGMTDLELAAEIEHEARRHGHQGLVRLRAFNAEIFYGHIFSGPDAAVPGAGDMPLAGAGLTPAVGQGSGRREIRQGDPIIVDIATCIEGYMCDQTRTFCVGTLPEPLASAYGHMVAVEDRMMALARPGASQGALHEECCEVAARFGHRDRFMGPPGAQVGFIGHGVGIELDEPPFIARGFGDSLLEEGMVFAFEPKAVFPGKGAVGIEDTFLVTAGGVERLTVTGRELVEL